MHFKGLVILLVTVTVLTGLIFVWYNNQIALEAPRMDVTHEEKKSESLGGAIYQEASNPLTEATITNPFDVYKNPFGE